MGTLMRIRNFSAVALTIICLATLPGMAERETEPAVYYKGRGDYHFSRKEYAAALVDYQQALRIEPRFAECHFKLGLIYAEQRHFSYATNQFRFVLKKRRHLEYKPLILDSLFEMAHVFFLMGKDGPTGPDFENTALSEMERQLVRLTNMLAKDPDFITPNRPYHVNTDQYLANVHYILARYYREQPQTDRYPGYFRRSLLHLERLLPKTTLQKAGRDPDPLAVPLFREELEYVERIRRRIAECCFYLWEYETNHGRSPQRAADWLQRALAMDPTVRSRGLLKPIFPYFEKARLRLRQGNFLGNPLPDGQPVPPQ
jgi:tetratricopeptide (TPR) repeat protein